MGSYHSLMAPPSIQDFADVRGKPVGTSEPRGATTLIMRKLFGLAGLGEQDYDLVVVGGTRERYTALKAGTIYAALLAQPQDFQLADDGFRRLALSTSALKPYVVGAIAANPEWMRQNEARTVRYLRAVIRGTRWLTDPANKEAAIGILMDETKAEERYARLTYALYLEEEQVIPPEAEMDPRSLDTVLDLMVEANDLPSPRPPASKYIDPSYRERARHPGGRGPLAASILCRPGVRGGSRAAARALGALIPQAEPGGIAGSRHYLQLGQPPAVNRGVGERLARHG